ncbi:HigA family addiction module antitoxin [Aminivibrio sp.]|uniref:HigA family addiction module antitoxin n=1 Tax=Aminivibrio sp. TaxID=1872489 RepID=UPI003D9641E2
MSKIRENEFFPDYLVRPGEILADYLDDLCMTQAELADRTGLSKKTINEIISGKSQLTPETARKLEKVLGRPAHFWSNLERQYQDDKARIAERERMESSKEWLKRFCVKKMTDLGWLPKSKDKVEQADALLRFFGIASYDQWETVFQEYQVSYRKTTRFQFSVESLSAWLRRGEILARGFPCAPYNRAGFQKVLGEIRRLTREKPDFFVPRLKELCASVGVVVLFVPELPKCGVYGATRWIGNKAVIQLSMRYKSNDQLWFTFFHEAGHILKHGRKEVFIEFSGTDSGKEEEEADAFAQDKLIPPSRLRSFVDKKSFSRGDIVAFADEIGIAPGIVLGRLQHDGILPFNHFLNNELKIFYSDWEKCA